MHFSRSTHTPFLHEFDQSFDMPATELKDQETPSLDPSQTACLGCNAETEHVDRLCDYRPCRHKASLVLFEKREDLAVMAIILIE